MGEGLVKTGLKIAEPKAGQARCEPVLPYSTGLVGGADLRAVAAAGRITGVSSQNPSGERSGGVGEFGKGVAVMTGIGGGGGRLRS